MQTLVFLETVEHRFVFDPASPPLPVNATAQARAYQVARAEVPDTDLVAAVWKVPAGAVMQVPESCARKLVALGYAAPEA